MTAVIYARYSTDSQREESIEGQIRECTAYAEKNGFTVVKHYIDRAISAKTDNRPQFQQMIKDSERGIFDVIIVWKLDRFARNRYDSARYKTQLKRNGVKLVSATEVISAGPEGIILESVLEGYAESMPPAILPITKSSGGLPGAYGFLHQKLLENQPWMRVCIRWSGV